jgi:hypothetical protein
LLLSVLLVVSNVFLWKAAQNNAAAAKDAAVVAKKALLEIERAFVFLDGFTYELTTAADSTDIGSAGLPERYRDHPGLYVTRFAVLPNWRNSGATPAKDMTIQINFGGAPRGLDPAGTAEPTYDYKSAAVPFALGPGATALSEPLEWPGVGALVDWSFDPVGDAPLYLIWGRADYKDAFGEPHFIKWCYRVRLERHDGKQLRAAFIQWGDHNRSD